MSGIGGLLGLGAVLAIAHKDAEWMLTPLQKAVDGVAWAVWLLDAIWLPVTIATPWLVLAGLWQVGRRHGSVPRWAAPTGGREHPTVIVTPGGIATRPLAEKHPDLRPVVALFSECHELFGHDVHGKEAADLAVQTMRRARKTAITLAFDTQSSRADAIPPKIVELVKLNACFAVKSWRSNDGFLGDESFQAGIRATELRMGKDVGTSILTGATPERFEIVKCARDP